MKERTKRLVIATVLAVLVSAWIGWMYYPLADEELAKTDARVVARTRYVLMSGNTVLLAFNDSRADTLLTGIVEGKGGFVTDTIDAQWARRWQLLPYSGGYFVTAPYDTLNIVRMKSRELHALMKREAAYLDNAKKVLAEQREDIDYYLKTHTVTENGFDVVQRYSRTLTEKTDSVHRADSLVKKALRARSLYVKLERSYSIADSSQRIRFTRLGIPQAMERLEERKRESLKSKGLTCWIDSIGQYEGERDSLAAPDGYGRFWGVNGDFYEGEWQHGKRTGVGFAMVPGKRLRLGEWKDDKFLGERITYTPDRIYGIDISRYQHEKGRKRYSIDWKNLRITSLGTYSKKNIKGEVNYPVSFVYVKATEGTTVKNKYFAADYAASRKWGHRTGAYHFFSLKTLGSLQAYHFLMYARYQKGDMPPVLDIEPTDKQIRDAGGIDMVFRNVRGWLSVVEKRWGVRPILYINQRFVNKYLPSAPDLKRDYDVWIARYGEYKPDVNLVFWQLCQDGRVNGIHGPVDLNVYNGFSF